MISTNSPLFIYGPYTEQLPQRIDEELYRTQLGV